MLLGCVGNTTPFENDNAYVRDLQKKETNRHVPEVARQKELKQEIGRRVGIIRYSWIDANWTSDQISMAERTMDGRAAAVSSDGYYLTAYHVVDQEPFYLLDTKLKKPLQPGPVNGPIDELVEEVKHKGHLVWFDPDHDLALIKFDQTNLPHFETMRMELNKGEVVYTADDQSVWIKLPQNSTGAYDWKERYGNGSFFSAGKVLASDIKGQSHVRQQHTTLVARQGISGSPLVTSDGALCGVISFVTAPYLWIPATTDAFMISPVRLKEIIESDRQANH